MTVKKYYLSSFFIFCSLMGFCQEGQKEAHYNYLTLSVSVFTNTPGAINHELFPSAEFGRTYGIFDIGLAIGRLNFIRSGGGVDSNWFAEIRPTINVFSKGRFSESLTLGAGYIVNAKQNFVTELTNCINFSVTNNLNLALCVGNYFRDGKFSTATAQFFSFAVTYNFIKKDSEADIKKRKALFN